MVYKPLPTLETSCNENNEACLEHISRILSFHKGSDDHSSRIAVTNNLKRSTRIANARKFIYFNRSQNVLSLFDLASGGVFLHLCYHKHKWALTSLFHPYLTNQSQKGGIFSVALSLESKAPRRQLTGTIFSWSPDFPLIFIANKSKKQAITLL